jgi:hypothetical protein
MDFKAVLIVTYMEKPTFQLWLKIEEKTSIVGFLSSSHLIKSNK